MCARVPPAGPGETAVGRPDRGQVQALPELPDPELYRRAAERQRVGRRLLEFELRRPVLLRSHSPAPAAFIELRLAGVERLGKRLVLAVKGPELFQTGAGSKRRASLYLLGDRALSRLLRDAWPRSLDEHLG